MLGSNVPTIGGLPNGFRHAAAWGCECIQVYLTPSRTWAVPDLSEDEVVACKSAWSATDVRAMVAHIPFLVNVASENPDVRSRAIKRLGQELSHGEKLGANFLVLHPGSAGNAPRATGIARVAEGLRIALEPFGTTAPKLLVETMAGQGSMIGSTFGEIARILELADRPNQLGVCFDTAHAFISGYDIRGYDGYETVMAEFDRIVGCKHIFVFHVNDAKTHLGSGSDRHANIGEGRLGLQVFHALVRDPRFLAVPMILEIPDRDAKSEPNLRLLKEFRQRTELVAITRENDPELVQMDFSNIDS